MRKARSFSRWCLLMGVACGLAMLPVANRAARAETISITITGPGGIDIPVDPTFVTGGTSTNYGTVDTVSVNLLLTAEGSALQLTGLGGSSNWSGASTGGSLLLTGGVSITPPTTPGASTSLTITETESGFNTPSGSAAGTLSSSSTVNYLSAGPGNSSLANSANFPPPPSGFATPTYLVASTNTGTDPERGEASVTLPSGSFAAPYTLTNVITINLTPNPSTVVQAGFSVGAQATVVPAIPEPASVVTMLIGLPLPLVGLAWLRRRAR
jgi:hypothetical protein